MYKIDTEEVPQNTNNNLSAPSSIRKCTYKCLFKEVGDYALLFSFKSVWRYNEVFHSSIISHQEASGAHGSGSVSTH